MNKNTHYRTIAAMIDAAGSQVISVTFRKKTGQMRTIPIQQAALATHVKGERGSERHVRAAKTRAENHPNLMPVFDMGKRAIRSINMDTVTRIATGGHVYEVA